MSGKAKVIATIVIFTVVGFLIQSNAPIGGLIWPPSDDIPAAEGAQIPLFMLYGLIAAIGFGVGFAFLLFGRPLVKALGLSGAMTTAVHLSIFWVMANWAVHDSLHINNGHELWGLLRIEFGFHATLVVAGILIVVGLLQAARRRAAPAGRAA